MTDLATSLHASSDHGRDGEPYGGPLCNCDRLAERVTPL